MAGPLSSEEIEDVVSSVRRLVSNELAPRRHSRDLRSDPLLLTPALRVVSEIGPLAPLVLQEKLEEPTVAEVPPASTPASTEVPEPLPDDAVQLIEAEWEDEIWAAPDGPGLGEVALGLDEAEVLVADREEPLHPPTDDPAATRVEAEPRQAKLIPLAPRLRRSEGLAARLPGDDDDRHAVANPASADAFPSASTAEQPLAEDDLPQAPRSEQSQPTEAWPDPSQPDAVAAAHAADGPDPDTVTDQPEPAATQDIPPQRMPTEIIDADGTPLAVLDEAALQDIVRQMIREELQGDLGERITRNVRKLVRAEINRALMARDLD